jgi:cellulose synthase operon protein C
LRLAAIDALGALGVNSPATDDALVPLLADTDPAVRLHAAVALAASGGPKARGVLIGKLDGGEELDRFALLAALGGILERHPDEGAAQRLASELAVAAGPERDAVIEAAFRARIPVAVNGLGVVAKSADVDDRRAAAGMLGGHRGSQAAFSTARALLADSDATVRAQAAYSIGALGDASTIGLLVPLTKSGTGDVDVAGNAVAGIARIALATGKANAAAIGGAVCPLLSDARATVRANALAALAAASARCSDGRLERKLLADDAVDLVRANAARAIAAAPNAGTPDDRVALERCASSDRSAEVAKHCRSRPTTQAAPATKKLQAVTVFVVGENGGTAKPRAPFLLEYEGGILRAGVADRRGATFDPAAPAGEVVLRRSPGR